jgi:hypothetical protein
MPTFYHAWNDPSFTYTWIRDQWMAPARQFYLDQTLSKEEQRELYRRLKTDGPLQTSITLEAFARQLPHIPSDILGPFLFRTLPLTPQPTSFLSSEELFQTLYQASPTSSPDAIRATMRQRKLAPSTFLFADTNWPDGYFSFVLHPITLQLEIWKTDRAGVTGTPLPLINTWLGDTWSIFLT